VLLDALLLLELALLLLVLVLATLLPQPAKPTATAITIGTPSLSLRPTRRKLPQSYAVGSGQSPGRISRSTGCSPEVPARSPS